MPRAKVTKTTNSKSKQPTAPAKSSATSGDEISQTKNLAPLTDLSTLHAETSPDQSNGKPPAAANLLSAAEADNIAKAHAAEVAEKIKELVRLAQEQGYLTYGDINDALPDALITPEDLDEIYIKLRNLEVEIVDQAEVDRIKQPEPEEDDEKTRLDI